ncbi:MAG: oxidoreductase [Candidatus Niyogibacteria bacterium CG10_big_fil_rev_8_21_14_0_10_46_36]|uniref:Oxidoreductase n=1 Tax=Candidatus Niyogibacteria bacterium CG10_big_fil_rev_8_21_14_0_10_46_36 TaxID=1974726 RepID=A0A2H0TCV8_9BACT|nr:MAG: oxidoreductase [Candidatus Niyogibacteria bacterium CG10_big_fil_rev_8_21_14_0_10_46_36]
MKKGIFIGIGIGIIVCGSVWAAFFYWNNLRGAGPAIKPPVDDVAEVLERGGMPFMVPDGFSLSLFADNMSGARVIAFDALGNMWVSRTSEGVISLIELDESGDVLHISNIFRNLNHPHGIAFDPDDPQVLYFAEENSISRVRVYSDGQPEKIADLPSGGGHSTRTIAFGPDGRLYVSIGSSCNVCREEDPMRAKIFSLHKDGSDMREYASGLRNAVFFGWSPFDGRMWATEMGRDELGDNTPPDEINIIVEGGNYGWPVCYGGNTHDTEFDKNTYVRNPCMEPFELPSYIDLQAHSAPLGFAFIPQNSSWPEEYWHDLIVAYHGSWNRSVPTGYKLVRLELDTFGNVLGMGDFATGWLQDNGALGRPVDVVFGPDSSLYVSDDKAGVVYRITYKDI